MIGTFYSHKIGFEKIINLIKLSYPKSKVTFDKVGSSDVAEIEIIGGLFRGTSKLKITYRQRLVPSYQFVENEQCPLLPNLKGLYGFVSGLPSFNEKVKSQLLNKVLTINSEFSILQESGETKDLKRLILQIASEFKAILFVQPNTIISKSKSQHFLDERLNLILDLNGISEIKELYFEIDSTYFDADQENLSEDQRTRKLNNEEILIKHQVKVNRNLPCIESEQETELRTPIEIAQKLSILAMTNLVAFNNVSGEMAIDYFKKFDLWKFVTPKEKDFLLNPTEQSKSHETWKCECIWTLMWALGKVDELGFPNELCDLESIPKDKYPIVQGGNPNEFINSDHKLRSKSEIIDAADLYFRIDWACVDARLKNVQLSEVHPSIVYERHYALNWLIKYHDQEWDDVSCDT